MKNSKVDEETLYHLTLLRHGESTGNAQGLLQGQVDYELSPFGRQQVIRLAVRWVAEAAHFERIISSPLKRALQTAEIIANALDIPIEQDADWMERDFGNLSGRILSEQDLRTLRKNFKIPSEPLGETGESQWDAYHRAERAVTNLLQHPPGRYLVVAHGGIINQALRYILGVPPTPGSDGPRFILSNAAFASLSYAPNEQIWRLFTLNDKQHLEDLSVGQSDAQEVEQRLAVQPNHLFELTYQSSTFRCHIRQASSQDLDRLIEIFIETDKLHAATRPDILSIHQELFSSHSFYEDRIIRKDNYFLIADVQGEIAGGLHANVQTTPSNAMLEPRHRLTISNIAVKPTYRGLGLGRALMEQAHILASQLGLQTVELTVWEFNESARLFVEHLGYQTSRRVMSLVTK
jgi:2,3-bisphosphoglycerate-dependent phosphoglycerate mutase